MIDRAKIRQAAEVLGLRFGADADAVSDLEDMILKVAMATEVSTLAAQATISAQRSEEDAARAIAAGERLKAALRREVQRQK